MLCFRIVYIQIATGIIQLRARTADFFKGVIAGFVDLLWQLLLRSYIRMKRFRILYRRCPLFGAVSPPIDRLRHIHFLMAPINPGLLTLAALGCMVEWGLARWCHLGLLDVVVDTHRQRHILRKIHLLFLHEIVIREVQGLLEELLPLLQLLFRALIDYLFADRRWRHRAMYFLSHLIRLRLQPPRLIRFKEKVPLPRIFHGKFRNWALILLMSFVHEGVEASIRQIRILKSMLARKCIEVFTSGGHDASLSDLSLFLTLRWLDRAGADNSVLGVHHDGSRGLGQALGRAAEGCLVHHILLFHNQFRIILRSYNIPLPLPLLILVNHLLI